MPDPVEYLRQAYRGATRPLVPKSFTDPIADAIDAPALERSPWEARMRGFGAGAIEGLREQINPLNIAASAIPGYRAARGAMGIGRAARGAESAGAIVPDLIDNPGVRQVMPAMDDVDALIGDLTRNLAKIRPTPAAPTVTAGTRAAEFAAPGAEDAYNAANQVPKVAEYGEGLYRELMKRKFGGRGQ